MLLEEIDEGVLYFLRGSEALRLQGAEGRARQLRALEDAGANNLTVDIILNKLCW